MDTSAAHLEADEIRSQAKADAHEIVAKAEVQAKGMAEAAQAGRAMRCGYAGRACAASSSHM